jgi:hypothetical protein
MFTFTDKYGVEWDLSLDLASAKRIDNTDFSEVTEIKFAFLNPEREFFAELFQNVSFAAAMAFVIVQDQLDKLLPRVQEDIDGEPNREVLELYFIKGLSGQALRDLHRTLLRAVGDFFPGQQTVLSIFQTKLEKIETRLQAEMEALAPEMDRKLDEEMENRSAGATQELSNKLKQPLGEMSSSPASVG